MEKGYFRDLLIIEAKRDNLDKGFTQLAAELIALDQWTDSTTPVLWGAVTTGTEWRFGRFERERKLIVQDTRLYRVPEGVEELVLLLTAIVGKAN